MKKLDKLLLLLLIALLIPINALGAKRTKLIFALDLVRHGDRAPTTYLPELSNEWKKEEIGQLTELGAKNAELFGQKLRNYYVNKQHLLPAQLNNPTLIYAGATYVKRTQDTLNALLKGFYPYQYQNINVVIDAKGQGSILLPHQEERTNLKKELLNKLEASNTPDIISERTALAKLNSTFGTDFSLSKFGKIADLLYVSKIHNKPLLRPLDKVTEENILKLRKAFYAYNNPYPPYACLHATTFIEHIIELFSSVQTATTIASPYRIYVAHDRNITATVALLDRPMDVQPPYLADLRFEIFKYAKENLVKVSLDGQTIKVCADRELCPLEEFINTLKSNIEHKCSELSSH